MSSRSVIAKTFTADISILIPPESTLFARRDEVEEAWKFIDHIEHAWHQSPAPPPMAEFVAGSWGPKEADDLLQQDGNQWRRL